MASFSLCSTSQSLDFVSRIFFFSHCHTSLVFDVDRGVGGGAVPSSANSVDRDGVVSTRLQTGDSGGGLWGLHCELLRSLTT